MTKSFSGEIFRDSGKEDLLMSSVDTSETNLKAETPAGTPLVQLAKHCCDMRELTGNPGGCNLGVTTLHMSAGFPNEKICFRGSTAACNEETSNPCSG